jgi:hypothetical protein
MSSARYGRTERCFQNTVKVTSGLDGPTRITLTLNKPGIDIIG